MHGRLVARLQTEIASIIAVDDLADSAVVSPLVDVAHGFLFEQIIDLLVRLAFFATLLHPVGQLVSERLLKGSGHAATCRLVNKRLHDS